MKRNLIAFFVGSVIITLCSSWGFFAHYRINRLAVFTLPKGMAAFYKSNIEFITEHAVSADKRRYVDSTEAPRHYFDADHYGKHPFSVMPQRWVDAAAKYSSDTLNKYGTVPWSINSNYYWLVNAFKRHDTSAILTISANLGHYIADAHVPLHLTQNYDGQLTGQTGIHALWESRLPELFSNGYNYYAGRARYIKSPLAEAFRICRSSYNSVDSVLRIEKQLSKSFTDAQKYTTEKRGSQQVKTYSIAYCKAYHKLLKGMVERRMRESVLSIGSFWFSAWVDAGQPDLNKLIEKPLSIAEKKKLQTEESMYRVGKVYAVANQP
ncbi:zinc dependent phospholipase C family protein [Mucilaginibacter segetis]|uniref:S1/P1 Nuclease n=1 Tax=Mucilaginibacter segetis TaxID=2793071 RepID=A0A934PRN7_9SPHI|nr:zinc dependent phospholipase C family protein [Mucilaginibacter segetis]MBK0378392.1 S1/P1 Nuclease [Mucilaginibacter segetis]